MSCDFCLLVWKDHGFGIYATNIYFMIITWKTIVCRYLIGLIFIIFADLKLCSFGTRDSFDVCGDEKNLILGEMIWNFFYC